MNDANPRASEFGEVDKSKDRQYFIDYLDTVRARPGIREGKEFSFSLLARKPGSLVLDAGVALTTTPNQAPDKTRSA